MAEAHGGAGFKDALEESEEANLQEGFNAGWKLGVSQGKHMGVMRGLVAAGQSLAVKGGVERLNMEKLEGLNAKLDEIAFESLKALRMVDEVFATPSEYPVPWVGMKEATQETVDKISAQLPEGELDGLLSSIAVEPVVPGEPGTSSSSLARQQSSKTTSSSSGGPLEDEDVASMMGI